MTTFSFFPRVRQQTRGFPGIKHHRCFLYHDVIRTSQEVGVAFFSSVVRNAPGCSRAAINIHVLASSSTRLYSSAVASQPPKASARGSVGACMGCTCAREPGYLQRCTCTQTCEPTSSYVFASSFCHYCLKPDIPYPS